MKEAFLVIKIMRTASQKRSEVVVYSGGVAARVPFILKLLSGGRDGCLELNWTSYGYAAYIALNKNCINVFCACKRFLTYRYELTSPCTLTIISAGMVIILALL